LLAGRQVKHGDGRMSKYGIPVDFSVETGTLSEKVDVSKYQQTF
jgi:hypothetical protein